MIVAGQRLPILIATRPVDFRCGHQALALMVQTELKLDPHSGVTVNRNGLAVDGAVTHATGTGEREAATELSAGLAEGATLGADKGYDVEAFVEELKSRQLVPHVAINGAVSKTGKARKTAVPPQVAQSPDYAISLRCRKRIEEIFGWVKTTAGFTQLKVRGLDKVKAVFTLALAAYNLVRLPKLLGSTGQVCLEGGK